MNKKLTSTEIASFLELKIIGPEIIIKEPKAINNFKNNSISFMNRPFSQEVFDISGLLIIKDGLEIPKNVESSYIISKNPRLDFAMILKNFFDEYPPVDAREKSYISKNARIADDAIIGANCFIGKNVEIGSGTILNHNIVISDNTIIGNMCYLKSGSVIGEDGFGFDFDNNRKPIRVPHIGRVIISDGAEIGAKNTVVRATLGETIIGKNTKTDDHVHIAHNCNIGQNCIITAAAELSGSVEVGNDVWIGPNSSIMNNIKIGKHAMIGLGAVVTKSVLDFSLVAGSPAKKIGWVSKSREKLDLPVKTDSEEICELGKDVYSLKGSKLELKD